MGVKLSEIKKNKKDSFKQDERAGSSLLSLLNKDFKLVKLINSKVKFRFYAELNLLLTSGIDLRSSLEIMIESEKKEKIKLFFESLLNDIINGKSFSEVLEQSGEFSDYEYYSIRIGEESGKLREVLSDLAQFYEGKIEFQRTLVSTFSYPVIVILTAFGAVAFMLSFIVPIFEDAFQRFGGDLPALTKMVIAMSEFMKQYSMPVFLFILISSLVLYSQREKLWFKKNYSNLVLSIPVLGNIVRKSVLARFCHSMSLLISVNNPLVSSISLVRKMIQFYPVENALTKVEEDIINGELFYLSLKKHDIFPTRMISLIRVAEEVNKLEDVFNSLNDQYTKETQNATKTISSVLEPILIIFIGAFVGIILVAMYLPLFDIGNIMQ